MTPPRTSQLCAIHLRDDERVPAALLNDGQPVCADCDSILGGGGIPLAGQADDGAPAAAIAIGADTLAWLADPARPFPHELTPATVPPCVWRDIRACPATLKAGAIAEALRLKYNTVYQIRACKANRLPARVQRFLEGQPEPPAGAATQPIPEPAPAHELTRETVAQVRDLAEGYRRQFAAERDRTTSPAPPEPCASLAPTPSPLAEEEDFFESHLAEWLPDHHRQFALVQGQTLGGFFATWEEALHAGFATFGGHRAFLIREVLTEPRVYCIGASSVSDSPAAPPEPCALRSEPSTAPAPCTLTLDFPLTPARADRLWATLPFDEKAEVIRWLLARRWEAL